MNYFSDELGPLFLPKPTTAVTNRRLYCILLWALPRGFFFLSCFATLGVCPLTFPARARDPWTLPDCKSPKKKKKKNHTNQFTDLYNRKFWVLNVCVCVCVFEITHSADELFPISHDEEEDEAARWSVCRKVWIRVFEIQVNIEVLFIGLYIDLGFGQSVCEI